MNWSEIPSRIKWGWKDALEWSQHNLVFSLVILVLLLMLVAWIAR